MIAPLRRILFAGNLYRQLPWYFAVIGVIGGLFLWKLGGLTPGISQTEKIYREGTHNLGPILDNPVNILHKVLEYGLRQAGLDSSLWLRLPSVMLGLIFAACFYLIVRRWFGRFSAIFGTILFISLPWVVLTARHGTPDIMYFFPLALLAGYVWLMRTERPSLASVVFLVICALALYTPGLAWIVVIMVAVWRKTLIDAFREADKWWLALAVAGTIVILLPLALASVSEPGIIKQLLLIPGTSLGPLETLNSIARYAWALVWQVSESYPLILGSLPLLSVTHLALSIFGVYAMFNRARRELAVLSAMIIVGVLGAGLNKNLAFLSISVLAIGILFTAGLRFLYGEWKNVFPLNPLPRALAIGLVAILVLINLAVGVRYVLLAWPQSEPVENTYVLQ